MFKTDAKVCGVDIMAASGVAGAATSSGSKPSKAKRGADDGVAVVKSVDVMVHSKDNTVFYYRVPLGDSAGSDDEDDAASSAKKQGHGKSVEKVFSLEAPGHQGDARAMAISPVDDSAIISVSSSKTLKLWNINTSQCVRTIGISDYGISCAFLKDGNFAAVGTKAGHLELFDIRTGESCASIEEAHKGTLWSIAVAPSGNTLMTGGSDHTVKFWKIHTKKKSERPTLTLDASQTLEVPDDVLCVKYTPDGRLILASLLDSTVRAFHSDSHKQFLSFYGHKLPVLAMDVSSDSSMLITGSADKSVKIWGLDFGDCRRSLRAHTDSVMFLAFQPDTHYFFSGSRDATMKYWDGDRFKLITELDGQSSGVWSIVTSQDGEVVASISQDRLIRVWRRTDEPLFFEEEENKRMDEMFESSMNETSKTADHSLTLGPIEVTPESSMPIKNTVEAAQGADVLLEALEFGEAEKLRVREGSLEPANVLLMGMNAEKYVMYALGRVKRSSLEAALQMIPLKQAGLVLRYCDTWLKDEAVVALHLETICQVVFFLFRMHHSQIMTGAISKSLVWSLMTAMRKELGAVKRLVGFNVSAMKFLQKQMADDSTLSFL
mmetsp:Transcript_865/g.2290  ORF Transcript_865/g.2290 Transcript_865/m.2290 type:complete len:605 (-) Transcript_865:212-2026(-)